MYRPLKGIRVLDLTTAGAGPSCTKLLAEWGADVIWIEPESGSSSRTVHKFDFYTVKKRSLVLDLKSPEGRAVVSRLIPKMDVFITNYRTRAVKKLGLDDETLRRENPNLIYASLTGYGLEGPQADEPGYDPVAFWAKGGMLQDIAEQGSLVVPPISVGDVATGQALAGAVCAALVGRQTQPGSRFLTTSLLAESAYLNHDALIEHQYGEKYPKTRKAPRRSLLNTYQCRDGKWLVLVITVNFERDFKPLMEFLGLGELVNSGKWKCVEDTMYEHAPELVAILDEAFSRIDRDTAVAKLRALGIPVSEVRSTHELLDDPQTLANKYIYPLRASMPPDEKTEYVWVPSSPVKMDSTDSTVHPKDSPGPRLGEHSVEILREFGYTDDEIRHLLEIRAASSAKNE